MNETVPVWKADVFLADGGALCEGPRWDERTGTLMWVDILAGVVHEVDHAGRPVASRTLGEPIGSFAPREAGGYVLALATGLWLVDADWSGWIEAGARQAPSEGVRFNDGV